MHDHVSLLCHYLAMKNGSHVDLTPLRTTSVLYYNLKDVDLPCGRRLFRVD